MRKKTIVLIVFALAAVWVGMGIVTIDIAHAATRTVSIKNTAYVPPTLTVQVGDAVVWTNDETTPISHTTTSGTCVGTTCTPDGKWDSGFLNPGQSFTQTFTTTGTFPYFCKVHGSAMQGLIVVQASATVTPTTPAASPTNTTAPVTVAAPSPTNTSAPATATATATTAATKTNTPAASATATTAITPSTLPTTGGEYPGDPLVLVALVAVLLLGGAGIFLYARRA